MDPAVLCVVILSFGLTVFGGKQHSKVCPGLERNDYLHANNLQQFADCTTIDGNLRILSYTFLPDPHYDIPESHPDNLTVFQHVREITGFLLIQANHKDFTDLSFLSNLEVIHGRQQDSGQSLHILATSLTSLGLVSLRSIERGNLYILANKDLCYAHTIDWKDLFSSPFQKAHVFMNKAEESCEAEGAVCDPQCTGAGCWGPGPSQCLACRGTQIEGEHLCIPDCLRHPLVYQTEDGKCRRCHPECASSCTGPTNTDCSACKHVWMIGEGGETVCHAECPHSTYLGSGGKTCRLCHTHCEHFGCTGPSTLVGSGGCNACSRVIRRDRELSALECLPPEGDSCPDGYFHSTTVLESGHLALLCESCDPLCSTCSGPDVTHCTSCRYLRDPDGLCTSQCPPNSRVDHVTRSCVPCSAQCRNGCRGKASTDCYQCRNFKVYLDEEQTMFNCTDACPESHPYLVADPYDLGAYTLCVTKNHPDLETIQIQMQSERRSAASKNLPQLSFVTFSLLLIFIHISR